MDVFEDRVGRFADIKSAHTLPAGVIDANSVNAFLANLLGGDEKDKETAADGEMRHLGPFGRELSVGHTPQATCHRPHATCHRPHAACHKPHATGAATRPSHRHAAARREWRIQPQHRTQHQAEIGAAGLVQQSCGRLRLRVLGAAVHPPPRAHGPRYLGPIASPSEAVRTPSVSTTISASFPVCLISGRP